jgi:hypothetical protein
VILGNKICSSWPKWLHSGHTRVVIKASCTVEQKALSGTFIDTTLDGHKELYVIRRVVYSICDREYGVMEFK